MEKSAPPKESGKIRPWHGEKSECPALKSGAMIVQKEDFRDRPQTKKNPHTKKTACRIAGKKRGPARPERAASLLVTRKGLAQRGGKKTARRPEEKEKRRRTAEKIAGPRGSKKKKEKKGPRRTKATRPPCKERKKKAWAPRKRIT